MKKLFIFREMDFLALKNLIKLFLYSSLSKKHNKIFLNFIAPPPPPLPSPLKKKNVIKPFYTLNKTPLGETRYLSNLYYLLAAQAYSCLIQFLWLTGHHAVPEVTTLISFFMTYAITCHARFHSSHLLLETMALNPYLGKQRISLGGGNLEKLQFQNCTLKNYIFKIIFSKTLTS